ncbi:MAG: glycosyl hydrolase family 65 protein [Geminicoccaceae bacterium]
MRPGRIALVYGFAGISDHHGVLSFRPRIPAWRRLRLRLTLRGICSRSTSGRRSPPAA